MSTLLGCFPSGVHICAVCESDNWPVVQVDIDGLHQSVTICPCCVMDAVDRVQGTKIANSVRSNLISSEVSRVSRQAEPPRPRGRPRKQTLADLAAMRETADAADDRDASGEAS